MRAVRYGVTRDFVRGLDVVLANGHKVTLGGKLAKNSSGYSLKDLMIGSEGTLGVVTKITVKLLPKLRYSYTVLVPFHSINEAISAVPSIIASDLQPTAVEFMQKEVVALVKEYLGKSFPDTSAPAYLIVSIDATDEAEAEEGTRELAKLCVSLGAIDAFFADTDERKESIWVPRGAFLEAIKSSAKDMDECDVVVPIDKIPEFVAYVAQVSEEKNVRINYFGHAGDGNLHVYICYDEGDRAAWQNVCDEAMDLLYNKAKELSGQVSGEHGIGHAKVKYLGEFLEGDQIELMRGIKKVFDPKGIINPGKVVGMLD